jgi:hypothetical protein
MFLTNFFFEKRYLVRIVTTTAPQNSTKNLAKNFVYGSVYGHFYDDPRVPKGVEKKLAEANTMASPCT